MKLFVNHLPTRCLNCPFRWRQFVPAKVLIDHRKFSMEIIVRNNQAIDIRKAETFAFSQPMRASRHFPALVFGPSKRKTHRQGEWRWALTKLGAAGRNGDAELAILIAALDDDHLRSKVGLLDDFRGGAVRPAEDDDVEVMTVAPMVMMAAAAEIVIEMAAMGFGDAGKRNGGGDGGDGDECKLFHGDVPFGFLSVSLAKSV
jgi:hypothetical protein